MFEETSNCNKENGLRGFFRQAIRLQATFFGSLPLLAPPQAHLVIFTVALFLVWLLVRLTRCARRCRWLGREDLKSEVGDK